MSGRARFKDHRHAGGRREGNATPYHTNCVSRRWTEDDPGQHLRKDDLHLVNRKRGAEAVADAAAEGKEFIRARPFAEKAVGIEPFRVGPEVRPVVGKIDAWRGDDASRQVVPANAQGRVEPASHEREDRIQPLRLFDSGIQVLKLDY